MKKLSIGDTFRDDCINVDRRAGECDIQASLFDPLPFADKYFGEVFLSDLEEQLDPNSQFLAILQELWRVSSGPIHINLGNDKSFTLIPASLP